MIAKEYYDIFKNQLEYRTYLLVTLAITFESRRKKLKRCLKLGQ